MTGTPEIARIRAALAAGPTPDIRALFWQLRYKLLKLPRYSFLPNSGGGVERVPDSCGKWIEVDAAAGLCEVEEIDAMLAAAPCAGCGETCKRAKLCATCAGEIAAAPQPASQPIGEIVATKNEAGRIVAVTRQDDDGKILEVIATSMQFERKPAQDDSPAWHDAPTCAGSWIAESAARLFRFDEFNLHAYQNTSVRWFGPIPKDAT